LKNAEQLRSYESFKDSLRCFEWLDGVVPGASDIDLLIERHGHFLVIEAKPAFNGVRVPHGQHIALLALSNQPNTTVLLVGETSKDKFLVSDYLTATPVTVKYNGRLVAYWPPETLESVDLKGLQDKVRKWWDAHESA